MSLSQLGSDIVNMCISGPPLASSVMPMAQDDKKGSSLYFDQSLLDDSADDLFQSTSDMFQGLPSYPLGILSSQELEDIFDKDF